MNTDPTFWDKIAEEYARKPVENPAAFEAKIAVTVDAIRREHRILDIGCGTGSLVLRLAPSAAEVHGLDLSPEMIRIARAKAKDAGSEKVHFHVGAFDESFQRFDDSSLDGICAYSLLHLVEDRRAALAHIFRLLKPGGFLVSSTVCLGDTWVPYRPLLALMRALDKAPMVKILKQATLLDEIAAAGFVHMTPHEVGAKPTTAFGMARKPS